MNIKTIIAPVLGIASLFIVFSVAIAQTSSFTYPVAELGNCTDKESCRSFCQEEENRTDCKAFGKKHKLTKKLNRVSYPIAELGNCTDKESCRSFCQEETAQNSCKAFALKHKIKTRKSVHSLINKAKDELGCSTIAQCRTFCQNPDNRTSCRSFGLMIKTLNKTRVKKDVMEENKSMREDKQSTPPARVPIQQRLQKSPQTTTP